MKRLIFLPLLLFACAASATPPDASSADRVASEAARAGADAARAGSDAARASADAARAGDEAAREAADAKKFAELQARMNDLAQRMAEMSAKIGDQASASALRYLADGKRGMLGVVLDDDAAGLRVGAVTPDGPAERAGIRDGDVITAIDGKPVRNGGESELAGRLVAGKPVSLSVLRDGKTLQFHVTPERFQAADWRALARTAQAAARQSARLNSSAYREEIRRSVKEAMKQTEQARAQIAAQWGKGGLLNGRGFGPWWGLNLASLNPQLGGYFGTDRGALVLSVDGNHYPGLQSGDVITAADGHAVAGPEDLMRALQARPGHASSHIEVLRHGKALALDLKLPARSALLPPLPDFNPDLGWNPDPDPLPPTPRPTSSAHPSRQR
jgi:C-terminal processing protease CtpA/Prc